LLLEQSGCKSSLPDHHTDNIFREASPPSTTLDSSHPPHNRHHVGRDLRVPG
jgi:hypothetical protein